MGQITYQIQPYSYIQTLTAGGTHTLPSGSLHAEIRLSTDVSKNLVDHTWYGEIKFTTGSSYFLLYATTTDITDESTITSNVIFIDITSDSIRLTNKFAVSKNIQITIIQ